MYYLIEVTTYVDETPKAKGIYEYETEVEALAKYHKKLGGAMDNANYATELVMVVAENGVLVATDYFERLIEPVEEEVTEQEETPSEGEG